jgi:hypothetical protein
MKTIRLLKIGSKTGIITPNKRGLIMRKILVALGVIVALIAVGVTFFLSNLNGIVKTAIETVGTKVAGVTVSVAKVDISIKDGKGSIQGLSIANPKGFTTPTAISLGEILLAINPASVTKSPIEIKDIAISAPQITYELSGNGSNIDAIKKNVDGFVASNAGSPKDKPAPAAKEGEAKEEGGQTKLVIDKLTISGGKVTLATPIPGGAASANLPEINLKDIGKSKGGASPSDVASQLLDAISGAATKSVSGLGVSAIKDAVLDKVGGSSGAAGALKGLLGK